MKYSTKKTFDKEYLPDYANYILYDMNELVVSSSVDNDVELDYYPIIVDKKHREDIIEGNLEYYVRMSRYERREGYIAFLYYREDGYLLIEAPEKLMMSVMNIDIPAKPVFILGGIVGLSILIYIFSKLINKRLKKEIQPVIDTVQKIEEQNLDFNIPVSSIWEMNSVLSSIDIMRGSLKNSLENQWKRDEEERFRIQSLGHDIKTPLTVIKGNTEILLESDSTAIEKNILQDIHRNAIKIEDFLVILLHSKDQDTESGSNKGFFESVPFEQDLMKTIHPILSAKDIKVKVINNTAEIYGDKDGIKSALINILTNAIEFSPKGQEILFKIHSSKEYVNFIVEDLGDGFTVEALAKAKNKFFTMKKERDGKHYGLGLYIADQVAQKHNGNLKIENKEKGARVVLQIERRDSLENIKELK